MDDKFISSVKKQFCEHCLGIRELSLHIHELALFCDFLDNKVDVFKFIKGEVVSEGSASSADIAKWLTLASQLKSVDLNPYKYIDSHFYCEPMVEELDSDASHKSDIITPLTRFIFIANALEEIYRFSSSLFEEKYERFEGEDKPRNYSMKSDWLIKHVYPRELLPKYYYNLVNDMKVLLSDFKVLFDIDAELMGDASLSLGLSMVRNIRNQIAHGKFPIVEDPEYGCEYFNPKSKRMILSVLDNTSRLALFNIQIILGITNTGFQSDKYLMLGDDPDCGNYLKGECKLEYLRTLHLKQSFGLNELSQTELRNHFLGNISS